MSQAGRLGGGGGGTSREPITRYVVDGGGTGEYTTIQDAIDAAVADGETGALIFIKHGDYTEDLSLPGIDMCFQGDNISTSGGKTRIIGKHTTGNPTRTYRFDDLAFFDNTGTMFTLSGFSKFFIFNGCKVSGNTIFSVGDIALSDCIMYNTTMAHSVAWISAGTGDMDLKIYNQSNISAVGGSTTNIVNGANLASYGSLITGPLSMDGGTADIYYSRTAGTATISFDGANLNSYYNEIDAVTDFQNQSEGYFYYTIIDSGAANVITGDAGSTVYLDHTNFINNSGISTVTVSYEGVVKGNNVDMDLDVRGREMISDGDSGAGVAGTVQYTSTIDEALSTGNGTVLMKTANPGDSSGWLKIFANGNVRYIPYWTNISP